MIGVTAKLTIAQGKEAEFEETAKALVAKVNANEEGCVMYELYKSPQDSSVYIFLEKYTNQAALDAHGKTDYFLAAQAPLGACLAGAPDIQIFHAVG
ncbi:putative quinol monooxygenase [Hellea balneolensis]|uniref:putative quinol monooxygenase n=1 Tax=Hellea balneolensis TaxID=287478 RepID=UPI00040CB326|nr:putative quinol monooxygenase [Hellea balneolensis]